MDRSFLMALVLLLLAVLLTLMILGWRARQKRQHGVARPASAPSDLGETIGVYQGKYVATTATGDPLDRIAVHGLGFRGNATATVTSKGLLLQIAGTPDLWIARDKFTSVRRATWTIDRVVEQDGLHLVQWQLGDAQVDSYLRMDTPAEFELAVSSLAPIERQAS